MDGWRNECRGSRERGSSNTLFYIDCEFPSCGLLEATLKNSKATGNKTQALPKEDTCSLGTSHSLEPGMRSPLLPHPPHAPLPPFYYYAFYLEFTSLYLTAPSSFLSASSSGATGPDPWEYGQAPSHFQKCVSVFVEGTGFPYREGRPSGHPQTTTPSPLSGQVAL